MSESRDFTPLRGKFWHMLQLMWHNKGHEEMCNGHILKAKQDYKDVSCLSHKNRPVTDMKVPPVLPLNYCPGPWSDVK